MLTLYIALYVFAAGLFSVAICKAAARADAQARRFRSRATEAEGVKAASAPEAARGIASLFRLNPRLVTRLCILCAVCGSPAVAEPSPGKLTNDGPYAVHVPPKALSPLSTPALITFEVATATNTEKTYWFPDTYMESTITQSNTVATIVSHGFTNRYTIEATELSREVRYFRWEPQTNKVYIR